MSKPAPLGLFCEDLDELQAMSVQIEALAGSLSALVNTPARLGLVHTIIEEVAAIAGEMNSRLDTNRRKQSEIHE